MKIKLINWILLIDFLSLLLIPIVFFTSSSAVRIALGLPFLLYFPGYVLLSALFVTGQHINRLEKAAISIGISISVVILIGFGMSFTAWGITLETALYSVVAFILLASAAALIRRSMVSAQGRLTVVARLNRPRWTSSKFNKNLSFALIFAIFAAIGMLGYTAANFVATEKYTEFYILGLNGEAQDYPTDFIIREGSVSSVSYDEGEIVLPEEWGQVTLGIVNHEQQTVSYTIEIKIDGEPASFIYNGKSIERLPEIELQSDEKWEHEIGIVPQHGGNNQKVEFLLSSNGTPLPEHSLTLWINVTQEASLFLLHQSSQFMLAAFENGYQETPIVIK